MNPYRAIVHRDMKPAKHGRTLAGRLRSAWRRWLVWRGGTWRSRWERCVRCRVKLGPSVPVAGRCPTCFYDQFLQRKSPAIPAFPLVVPTIPDLVIPARCDGKERAR